MPEPSDKDPAERTAGVFGNLPTSRPGSRSPRRRSDDQAAARKAAARSAAKPADAPEGEHGPDEPAHEPRAAQAAPHAAGDVPRSAEGTNRECRSASGGPPAPGRDPARSRIESVEDLAWAGVAVAASAATAGVRLASRAMDALRPPRQRP